jgi:hypothetical protein
VLAIFQNGGFGTNLNAAIFNNFNQINRDNFLQSHDISLFPTTESTVALRFPVNRTGTD